VEEQASLWSGGEEGRLRIQAVEREDRGRPVGLDNKRTTLSLLHSCQRYALRQAAQGTTPDNKVLQTDDPTRRGSVSTAVLPKIPHSNCYKSFISASAGSYCGVVEADLELFCTCWSAGLLRERLYGVAHAMYAVRPVRQGTVPPASQPSRFDR